MMNGIDTIIQRLNIDAKAETDALLEKARQEAAAVAARYQAQADQGSGRSGCPERASGGGAGGTSHQRRPDGGPENGPGR